MSANERRALYYSADDNHDPYVQVDINEYLIENWPTLNLKDRKCIWTLCQNDEEFSFDEIHDQIDNIVYVYAEANDSVSLPAEDEETEDTSEDELDDDDVDTDNCVVVDVFDYISETYNLNEEKVNELTDELIEDDDLLDVIAAYIDDYVFTKTNAKPSDANGFGGDVASGT
tara:strand:- start:15 stop:530 length:516 start_codon:yes stop_codon:yes gene_type:complete